ncbi:cadherin-99C [Frankliniella occidentalis]|uniref:Cadherin-99C n=1 Tax=Frankliniella occidentalis TaxID=133901 RepID=A0A6J1RVM2_FRAOC|nr:cadherin-99C [Frankliniella occidentalis]
MTRTPHAPVGAAWPLVALLVVVGVGSSLAAKPGLCEVETGQSNIILDVEESRGTQINQLTSPPDLPVVGDPFSDIALDLVFPKGSPMFILNGKRLQLLHPLDRDQANLSHIVFQLICTVKSTKRKRTIPVIVRVSDINDNPPKFLNTPYETTVSELTPVGTTVFQGVQAVDADSGVNGLVEYLVVPGDPAAVAATNQGQPRVHVADGYGYFSINLPHQGQVTVNRSLDYERTQRYFVTIVATDRARNSTERLSSSATLTVNVRDDDDQDPSFIYQGCMLLDGACINPEYTASVQSGKLAGILHVSPEKIQAVDMDSINSPIVYSFLSGSPASFRDYFEINPQTGAVRQTQPVDTSVTKKFQLIIKAAEVSEAKRFATAKLEITVKPVDVNPPEIIATATEGYVEENSPVGTQILDVNGKPISFTVTDADLGPEDPKPTYTFEMTTNFFRIENGVLTVNEENLDRDPPSPGKFRFQVVAREKNGNAASAPLSLTVTLEDINDNAPRLPMVPPVSVQAGDGKREVIRVEATDNDEGENAVVTYSIYHVSNNGRLKFTIDPETGLLETTGKLNAGEQYSITVQATDTGGRSSQTIVEVKVIPGPNTRSPVFQQSTYEVQVSEGVAINTTVATITAKDPEDDPVSYSIVSGNDLRQFAIGDKTGVVTIIRKLDREDLTRYQLLIKAEDTGGLSSTATVNIKVTDINDKNPEFDGLPYVFRVREGDANQTIGSVHASDADEGQNAVVYYSVPEDVPFAVDAMTGEVRTKSALDYEKQKEFRFVVTARDGAPDPRLATATVTVEVMDVEDELPVFKEHTYDVHVPENVPDHVVTQVHADDPDTVQRVTYTIRQGPTDLFAIDPKTGVIRTLRGLDFERESQYILVVGTLENPGSGAGATTRVVVNVDDRNDIPPVFTTVARPVSLEDDVGIGTRVTTLTATDSDGTAPGNKVRYELIGRGKANKYFTVDPDTGVLSVRDDLRKETDQSYQVDIKAYDLGEPQLSSVMSVPVFIKHSATVAPETGLGFADDLYTVDVPENATAGALLKTLTIVNSKAHRTAPAPLHCSIVNGNEGGLFFANVTENRNCELRVALTGVLDAEQRSQYQLTVQLDTLPGLVNPARATTRVKVHVEDLNDNVPRFVFPASGLMQGQALGRYFGAVPQDAQIGTSVLQVKAEDADGGRFGRVKYALVDSEEDADDNDVATDRDSDNDYFSLDTDTGVLKTKRSLEEVPPQRLPFRLTVEARDNAGASEGANTVHAQVIVNIVTPNNLLVLVLQDVRPERVQGEAQRLVAILEQHSGLVVGVERLTARHFLADNATLQTDGAGTDVWFYAVDPETGRILERNSTRVQRSVLDKQVVSNITLDVSANLQATATAIHEPYVVARHKTAVAVSWEVFPYALIVIACVILVLGVVGIIYICVSWSRYKAYKERMQRMYVVPRYDPVFVEPNLKEYETQVLQMSVPLDDNDSYNDLQLDFSQKNHAFSMDNVSYITKENNTGSIGQQSPVSSDAATTARASSIAGGVDTMRRREIKPNNLTGHDPPTSNPLYDRSHEDNNVGHLNASATNENVLFCEKKDYSHLGGFAYINDRNSIETTTEL